MSADLNSDQREREYPCGDDVCVVPIAEYQNMKGQRDGYKADREALNDAVTRLRVENERLRETLHTIAADTHDYETAEEGRAWRVKLAHEVSHASDETEARDG